MRRVWFCSMTFDPSSGCAPQKAETFSEMRLACKGCDGEATALRQIALRQGQGSLAVLLPPQSNDPILPSPPPQQRGPTL
jgi:hypothetical protein